MKQYSTEQEKFWAEEFGNNYLKRNEGEDLIASNITIFSRILQHTHYINSIIELGSNIGMNLHALKSILPKSQLSSVEINPNAVEELKKIPDLIVHHESILSFIPPQTYNLVFTKGVLIHINPESLPLVYDLMYQASDHYICMVEYHNPSPIEINYRGHTGKLFKRDFAGELWEKHPDLKLLDYGFIYSKDPYYNHTHEDMNWFLFEKCGNR